MSDKRVRRHLVKWALKSWGWTDITLTKTRVRAKTYDGRIDGDWCQEALAMHALTGSRATVCACGKCPGAA